MSIRVQTIQGSMVRVLVSHKGDSRKRVSCCEFPKSRGDPGCWINRCRLGPIYPASHSLWPKIAQSVFQTSFTTPGVTVDARSRSSPADQRWTESNERLGSAHPEHRVWWGDSLCYRVYAPSPCLAIAPTQDHTTSAYARHKQSHPSPPTPDAAASAAQSPGSSPSPHIYPGTRAPRTQT